MAGYRSRAAFKLIEIEKQFSILRHARRIVDLCAAPGSWLQVVSEFCKGANCRIVGVDLAYIKPIERVEIIRESIEEPKLVSQIFDRLEGRADVVLSDCSPKLTGNKTLDRERQSWLVNRSIEFALQLLKQNGNFVTKVFHSGQFLTIKKKIEQNFESVKSYKPKSSFKKSPEMYIIAQRLRVSTTRLDEPRLDPIV